MITPHDIRTNIKKYLPFYKDTCNCEACCTIKAIIIAADVIDNVAEFKYENTENGYELHQQDSIAVVKYESI
jgi:hypothetical protein